MTVAINSNLQQTSDLDLIEKSNFEYEIKRRCFCYMKDATYIGGFGLRFDPKTSLLVSLDGSEYALKVRNRAPVLMYQKLEVPCRFLESASNLVANTLTRMASEAISMLQYRDGPMPFYKINGYDIENGARVRDFFEVFVRCSDKSWKPY